MLLANVPFIPELFLGYQQELSQNKSAFFRSGIIAQNPAISSEFAKGGRTITIPHFNDLSGSSEVLSDVTGLTAAVIGGNSQIGVRNLRGRAWQSSDLAGELSGADPLRAIAIRTGEYWMRDTQSVMISILKGLFFSGGPLATSHTSGGTGTEITSSTMVDALAVLGDSGRDLVAVAMHSQAFYGLVKKDLIVATGTLAGVSQIDSRISSEYAEFGTYLGRPVIVDDTLPISSAAGTGGGAGKDVHNLYFFGPGALVYSEVLPKVPVETDRDVLKGIEVMVNRKEYLMHPNGVSWTGSAAGNAPTNAEFEVVANWTKVFTDNRNIKMVNMRGYV